MINYFWTVLFGFLCLSSVVEVSSSTPNSKQNGNIKCPEEDSFCKKDRMGFEAITSLHASIDDDRDGNLDRSESDEFIRDELKYEDGFERHTTFHGSDDNISIKDLWSMWTESEVYNWTAEEVIDWLESHVELPQYTENFRVNEVEGRALPRLAASGHFMTSILGIKNAIDKQKLAVKAQDVVLFGAPKKPHSYVKDVLLVLSLVIAAGGCWLAYMQHKYSQSHLKKVMKDLDSLQKSEEALFQLQTKLEEAHKEKDSYKEEKQSLENKMKDEIDSVKQEAEELRVVREATAEEIGRLKLAEQELEKYKRALSKAEIEIQKRHQAPLGELQQWLQLTYEMETRHYEAKREAAEKQLLIAKEMCEKIRRKRGTFFGPLRVAHTTSVDDTDHSISCARSALEEVKTDLQERSNRWHQIEKICGFSIVSNPGLDYLDSLLRSPSGSVSCNNLRDLVQPQLTVDDADDADVPPGAYAAQASFYGVPPLMNGRAVSCKPNLPYNSDFHLSPPLSNKRPSGERNPILFNGGRHRSLSNVGDHSVWPNLMRAGMQLTMLGFNLTDPRLSGAIQPFPVGPEHLPGLTNSYGSYDALAGASSLIGGAPGSRPMTRTQGIRSTSAVSQTSNGITGKQTSITDSTDSEDLDGKVSFDLGENSSSNNIPRNGTIPTTTSCLSSTNTMYVEDIPTESTQKYGQSMSVEAKSSGTVVRPRILPSSLSEGTLSGLAGLKQMNTGSGSASTLGSHGKLPQKSSGSTWKTSANCGKSSPVIAEAPEEEVRGEEEDGASNLSTSLDSLNSNGKEKSGSKKRSKLFNKIFKGGKVKES